MKVKSNVFNSFPIGRVAIFVTGNIHKFNEVRSLLAKYRIATAMLRIEAVEIQDDNLESIARTSAIDAVRRSGLPIIVEDSGLFIKALNGFPGPYSSYVYRKVGTKGVLKLMENINEREAYFQSVVAFGIPGGAPKCFQGKVKGEISIEMRGSSGFGFDPIFEPSDDYKKTFAEMTMIEKNWYSHRAKAMQKFAKWYTDNR